MGRNRMLTPRTKLKSPSLSVGEAARRLGVSPDTIRDYCERGLLQFVRTQGNHRRILLRSVVAFEKQRAPAEPVAVVQKPPPPPPKVDEDFEIYYLGNHDYPNNLDVGFVCNFSYLESAPSDTPRSSIAQFLAHEFGGGVFRIVRVREGFEVNERTIEITGETDDLAVIAARETSRGPRW